MYNRVDCCKHKLSRAIIELHDKDDNILAKHQVGDLSAIESLEVGVSNFAIFFRLAKDEW